MVHVVYPHTESIVTTKQRPSIDDQVHVVVPWKRSEYESSNLIYYIGVLILLIVEY